jgi:hypothetical protein
MNGSCSVAMRPRLDISIHQTAHLHGCTVGNYTCAPCCDAQRRAHRGSDHQGNPLRVKGGGEAGITPALAVIMNAVIDALSPYGIEHLDMPATPARVWEAIRAARS